MKNFEKSHIEDDSSSFDALPDDIVLQIFRKLVDLKALCACKLVSKRFYRIIRQVDAISFITKPDISFDSVLSLIQSLSIFGGLKSLCIQIPDSSVDCPLFKWKIKFGGKLDSFIYLSPNSIYSNKELYVKANGHGQEEGEYIKQMDVGVCLTMAMLRHLMLLICIKDIPFLEDISIMDCDKRWKVSLSGVKVTEMRNELTSSSESIYKRLEVGVRVSRCHIPLLELPISGYVMKGVTFYVCERDDLPEDEYGRFWKTVDADFEDKEESAYCEGIMEIIKNHMGRMERLSGVPAAAGFF